MPESAFDVRRFVLRTGVGIPESTFSDFRRFALRTRLPEFLRMHVSSSRRFVLRTGAQQHMNVHLFELSDVLF